MRGRKSADESRPLEVIHDNREIYPADGNIDQFDDSGGAGAVVVHHAITAILIVMVLAIGTWAYLTFKNASFFEASTDETKTLEPFIVRAQIDRLTVAIDVYHKLNDEYPASLDELVETGILDPSDPYYPPSPNSSIEYRRSGASYELVTKTVTSETVSE